MADKTTKTAKQLSSKVPPKEDVIKAPPKPKKKRFKLLLKITSILLLILVLGGIGFAAGVFFKIIDTNNLGAQLKLSEYPLIGKYFAPKTNFDKIDEEMQKQTPQEPPVMQPDKYFRSEAVLVHFDEDFIRFYAHPHRLQAVQQAVGLVHAADSRNQLQDVFFCRFFELKRLYRVTYIRSEAVIDTGEVYRADERRAACQSRRRQRQGSYQGEEELFHRHPLLFPL
jgi:preprotein translocase subunit Sss1